MRITLLAFLVLFVGGLRPAFGRSNAEKIDARDAYISSNIVSIFIMNWGMQLSIRCRYRFLAKKKTQRMLYPF